MKFKLGFGAGVIGLFAILASALTLFGASQMSARIETAMEAQQRMQRFSVLATQVGSFIVVAFEASQAEGDLDATALRLDGLTQAIRTTFTHTRRDLDAALKSAEDLGLDEQSLRATRSLGIARMEALFNSTVQSVLDAAQQSDPTRLQGVINAFSIGFDPLLNGAISEERRARDRAIAQVTVLRRQLSFSAFGVGASVALLLLGFYVGLVRPQMSRLDALRRAAQEIGQENFAITLPRQSPDQSQDEIGQLFAATQSMSRELAARKADVEQDWARLNSLVEERTEELRDANAILAKTDEDRRRFFADISHELRTPLTVILMEAELGIKAGGGDAFSTIHTRATRLNRRIDDLLRIARSESGVISLASEPFDLNDAICEAAEDMRAPLKNAGLTLRHNPSPGLMTTGDKNWCRQVITGLLENCIRHASDGNLVAIMAENTADGPSVQVVDNGPGVTPQDRANAFKRFARGGTQVKTEGFGIGLALANWIIEQQGGRIEMTSPVPESLRLGTQPGTLVTVFFPPLST
ncbi:MAG: HAMP domain-containing sensor histidine kinase [Paracoccaceae bacterium]